MVHESSPSTLSYHLAVAIVSSCLMILLVLVAWMWQPREVIEPIPYAEPQKITEEEREQIRMQLQKHMEEETARKGDGVTLEIQDGIREQMELLPTTIDASTQEAIRDQMRKSMQ